jgi:hypothetical protein
VQERRDKSKLAVRGAHHPNIASGGR